MVNPIASLPDLKGLWNFPDWLPSGPREFLPLTRLPRIPSGKPPLAPRIYDAARRYLQRIQPEENSGLEMNAGLPLVILSALGASLVTHGLIAGAGYYLGEKPLKFQVKDREEHLVKESQAVLEKLKKDSHFKPDYLAFLLGTETVGNNWASDANTAEILAHFETKFKAYQGHLSSHGTTLQKIYQLGHMQFWDYLLRYAASYPNLKNYLEHGKGNCQARTKSWLAALHYLNLELPPDYGFGIQVFYKHVQPVLYHRDSQGKVDWVQDLVSGKKIPGVTADIYQPSIIYTGFLLKHGETPALSFEDQLIARWKESGPPPGMTASMDEELAEEASIVWPASEARYDGDAPEDAVTAPPNYGVDLLPTLAPSQNSPSDHEDFLQLKLYSDNPELKGRVMDFAISMEHKTLYFRHPYQLDKYLNVKNDEERLEFLIRLVQASHRSLEADEAFTLTLDIFSNPEEKIPQAKLEQLEKIRDFLHVYELELSSAQFIMDRFLFKEVEEKRRKGNWETAFHIKHPLWEAYYRAMDNFRAILLFQPKRFFQMFDQLEGFNRRKSFLEISDKLRIRNSGIFFPLRAVLANPERVSISKESNEQMEKASTQASEVLFDINLLEDTPLVEITADKITSETMARSLQEDHDKITVSPEAMVQLLPFFLNVTGETPVHKLSDRWNAELSRTYLQMNIQDEEIERWLAFIARNAMRQKFLKQFPKYQILSQSPPPASWDYDKTNREYGELMRSIQNSSQREAYLPSHLVPVVRKIIRDRGLHFFRGIPPDSKP